MLSIHGTAAVPPPPPTTVSACQVPLPGWEATISHMCWVILESAVRSETSHMRRDHNCGVPLSEPGNPNDFQSCFLS